MLKYKDYIGHVEFDEDADIFHGEVINTKDVITFEGSSVKELKKAFIDSVEDYLELCQDRGESPEKPFSGRFNLRLEPTLHQAAFMAAKRLGMSLNNLVAQAVQHEVNALQK
jgi:predicted HicB family RNase H-like nuclease